VTYQPPRYITLQDMQSRFGVSAVSQFLSQDGSADPNSESVIAIIEEASGAADAYLLAAFGAGMVERLIDDPRFRSAVCDIAMSLAGETKQEFGGADGERAPYAGHRKRGEKMLDQLGKGVQRMGIEAVQGSNPTLRNRTTVTLPHVHTYATSRTNPRGSGGF
jgi:phage gp36-like protein